MSCIKYLMSNIFVLLICGTINISSALASPIHTHTTHTILELKPSSSNNSYKTAGVYWLPDYLEKNAASSAVGGGGDGKQPDKCEEFFGGNFKTNKDQNEICDKTNPGFGLTCYKNCYCPTKFKYNSSNCSSPQVLGGESCVGKYTQCNCPSGAGSCTYGCKNYHSSPCGSVCKECETNPCAGYYDCGGSWQYCTGSTCRADSSKCSNFCVSDYFPNSCSSSSYCNGVYRNGYCSGTCNEPPACSPYSNETGCADGTEFCSDGCGGTRQCCKAVPPPPACTPQSNETGCAHGTEFCSDGCGGTRQCCKAAPVHTHSYSCPSGYSASNSWGSSAQTASKSCSCGATSGTCYKAPACSPLSNETGCSYGTKSCSDGCGGTRNCCSPACVMPYRYGFTSADCFVRPYIMEYQRNNLNCATCKCDNINKDCGGKICPCSVI